MGFVGSRILICLGFLCVLESNVLRGARKQGDRPLSAQELHDSATTSVVCRLDETTTFSMRKGDTARLVLANVPTGPRDAYVMPRADVLEWSIPPEWNGGRGIQGSVRYSAQQAGPLRLGFETGLSLRFELTTGDEVSVSAMPVRTGTTDSARVERLRADAAGRAQKDEQRLGELNHISLEERVEGFTRLWSEVRYNFVFFEHIPDPQWDKVLSEYLPKVIQEQTTREYYGLLEKITATLRDGHTTVYPPHELVSDAQLPLRLVCVDGRPVVSETAAAATFSFPPVGWELTRLDGRAIVGVLASDVYPFVGNDSPQNRERQAYRRLLSGPKGTTAAVTLQGPGGHTRELVLTRLAWRYPDRPSFVFADLGDGLVYTELNSFSDRAVAESFASHLEKISGARGLIIDIRNNGGGSTDIGYSVISHLTDKTLPGSRWRTRKYLPAIRAWGREQEWHEGTHNSIAPAEGVAPFLGPTVVLIGPDTVSAAEDFAVALHASRRAVLVGTRTAGSTGQPLMVDLPKGGRVRICTKHDKYPDGREFVHTGVVPDVETSPTRQSLSEGRDPALEKAVELIAAQSGIKVGDPAAAAQRVRTAQLSASLPAAATAPQDVTNLIQRGSQTVDALAAAVAKNDLLAVGKHSHDLRNLVRDGLQMPFQATQMRQEIEAEGSLDEQAAYTLRQLETARQTLETALRDRMDVARARRLAYEVHEISDDISDNVRDGITENIPVLFQALQGRWKELQKGFY